MLSGLDLDRLKANKSPQERSIVEDATKVYSRDFGKFWRQEDLKVGVYIDGSNLVSWFRAIKNLTLTSQVKEVRA